MDDTALLANASQLAVVGHWEFNLRSDRLEWSDTTCRLFGVDPHRFTNSFDELLRLVEPEDRPVLEATLVKTSSSARLVEAEYRIRRPDGQLRWMQERGIVEFDESGTPLRQVGSVIDITVRKRAEEKARRLNQVYALLSAISTTILRAQDDQTLFEAACRIAVHTGGFHASCVGLIEIATGAARPVAWSGNIDYLLADNKLTINLAPSGQGPFGLAVRENRVAVCNDIASDPEFDLARESALAHGFRSAAVFPLRREGGVFGGFALYSTITGFFDSEETILLERLADDMSVAIGLLDTSEARRAAEAARRATEERMRAVFEQAGLGICVVADNYRFERVNEKFCRMLGYTMQELLDSHTCIDTTHPDDREADARAVSQLLDGAASVTLEKRYVHRSGRGVWVQLTLSALRSAQGNITGFVGIVKDIADQRKAMEDRDRFFDLSRDMLSISDLSGAFLHVNREWTLCLGWSPEELVGLRFLDLVHPDDLDVSVGVHTQLVEGAPTRDIENRYRCKDGSYRWISWHSRRVHDAGQIVSSGRDVTERRAREAQLLLLDTCISRMNDIVMITEASPIARPGPRIVFVNDAFVKRTGYLPSEVIGKTPRILQGPKTDRRELDRIRSALAERRPVRSTLVNYTKTGEEFSLELDLVPVINADDQCTHFISVERDITERSALEERLRQAERMEAVGQLTGGLAHDFNNLLSVVIGNADLLCEELPPVSPQRELAQAIGRAAQRGAELTKRLLAFGRQQALEARAVDVNIAAAGMRGLLVPILGDNILLQYRLASTPCIALVDLSLLENAVLNLCVNARDAMPDGGRLTIDTAVADFDDVTAERFSGSPPGRFVMIAVADTGIGIAPDVVNRVFEPFFTTKGPGHGTGMGLAMVFGFVKQSGGHINLVSKPGEGTTIKMYFPLAAATDLPTERQPDEHNSSRGNENILLVEDDDELRRFALKQVSSLGYRVTVASDARTAIDILRSGQPIDLLFTDVLIPGGLNGRQLAESATRWRPGLKVLYTSGYSENALVSQDRLDDDVILLKKPYRKQDLARYLRRALDGDAQ